MRLWLLLVTSGLRAPGTGGAIQRVVQLLNDLRVQVDREGKEAEAAWEKFMCFCQTAEKENAASVAEQKERVTRLAPAIEENAIQLAKLEEQVKGIDAELAEHKEAEAQAKSIRDQEKEKWAADRDLLKQSVSGLGKAIAVLEKAEAAGYQQAFLQASPFVKLSLAPFAQLSRVKNVLDDSDLQKLLRGSFLQAGPEHILGVLQGLLDGFTRDLADGEQREADSSRAYDDLSSGKTAEIRTAYESARKLGEEKSQLASQLARDRDDLASTQVTLHRDGGALADLEQECKEKDNAERIRKQSDLEELLAINEAVTILSEDDDTFVLTKTVAAPAPVSFLQRGQRVQPASDDRNANDVLAYLQKLAAKVPANKALTQLASKLGQMSGQNFDHVTQVIGKQVDLVDLEQSQDDEKKAWCEHETRQNTELMHVKHQEASDAAAQQGSAAGDRTLLVDEVTTLKAEEKELKDQLYTAQQNRAEELKAYDSTLVEVKTAQQALVKAIQVLESVYGAALLQTNSGLEVQAQGEQKVGGRAKGGKAIVALIAQIGEDLVAQENTMRAEEQAAAEGFAKFRTEVGMSLKLKASQLVTRSAEIARLEQAAMQYGSDADAANALLRELEVRRDDLAKSCGLLAVYDKRKTQRAAEKGAMLKAVEILTA